MSEERKIYLPSIINPEEAKIIAERVYEGEETKTAVAKSHNVSTRTIGRVLEWFDAQDFSVSDTEEEEEVLEEEPTGEMIGQADMASNDFTYFVAGNKELINITRIRIDGSEPPTSVILYRGDSRFEPVMALVENEDLHGAFCAGNESERMKSLTKGRITFDPEEMAFSYNFNGKEHPFKVAELSERLIDKAKKGEDVTGLMKFSERLFANEDIAIREQLFAFLKATDIKIDDDGYVVAFKRVRGDYMDCHSGSFDNTPGKTLRINRSLVEKNPNIACAAGLHVCSRAYLGSFHNNDKTRIVKVRVDPADFVSVPYDYYKVGGNNQVTAKARVCAYEVVEDISGVFMDKHAGSPEYDEDEADDDDFAL